ncbi:kinesin-II 95 kDa subunit [Selaginella moellendorffii]|uniref:kinesin-II 95 kDa subunit n=1 Tax=Selaginella moellendorffii TaxID=88036 RepID=UPI000D1CB143|nr:kinesin-II 95 kDa subunit [Selaginella moellendorffii]|eukprot:XP_024529878.1 kinesin-II 95 kDa subunit [Selaginella moellendorffii]
MSHQEAMDGRQCCIVVDQQEKTIEVSGDGRRGSSNDSNIKVFTFDRVYDSKCTQNQLYQEVAHPIVQSVMHGYNGTVLAYGQTASGKTYTMEGFDDSPELRGIIPHAFEEIFSHISQSQSSDRFLVRASYLEIYNEEIRDLLAPSTSPGARLELKESPDAGVYVRNLTCLTVHSLSDIIRLLMVGKKNRSVGATLMNQDSSRSHSIFTITVETSVEDPETGLHIRVGKLNLVDLAGSERMSKTGATGDRLKELTNINWSLTALGNVISALVDGRSTHIPYRDSKLTRLLQDSLGGNTRTVMVANIGPADYNYEESVSTLRYANRAKSIKNKPRINEDPKDALLREFQAEIIRLKAQLSGDAVNDLTKEICTLKNEKEMVEKNLRNLRQQAGVDPYLCQSFSEQAISYIKADLEKKAHFDIECLRAEKERSDEEKQKLTEQLLKQLKDMQTHYESFAKEKEDRDFLTNKLRALEDKVLHGSNNDNEKLVEKAKQQEEELALYQHHIQERQQLDEERQRKIAELEDAQLMAEVKCSTMEEELEMKTTKFRKLMACYQQSKADLASLRTELQDTIHEFHRERTDLLLSLRSLEQQHQLKSLVIEKFIPSEELAKIMKRVEWDDETERWVFQSMVANFQSGMSPFIVDPANKQPLQRPASAVGRSRPPGSRYQMDNVLKIGLDIPKHTLYDYENHLDRAQAQAHIMQAFSPNFGEDDGPYLSYEQKTGAAKPLRPRTANR